MKTATRFTDRYLMGLKPRAERYERWEGGGFGVRVTPRGKLSFVWVYHFGKKPRRLTLGEYGRGPGKLSLAQARVKLAEAREVLDAGDDPGAQVVEDRKAERAAETVGELVETYIDEYAKPRKKTWQEDERILNTAIVPMLGHKKITAIKRREISSILAGIVDRGAPIAANRTLAVVRRMFRFAVSRGLLEQSPAYGIEAPAREKRRDRHLQASQIKAFWKALPSAGAGMALVCAARFLLATGQRRSEAAVATWSEFSDLDGGNPVWTIPPEHTKNDRRHAVPLNSVALSVLADARAQAVKRLKREPEAHEPVFLTLTRKGVRPVTPDGITRAVTRAGRKIGYPISPHDLRRTMATLLPTLGTSRFIISRLLNHVDNSVTGAHYDLHEYSDEKRDALNAWGRFLEEKLSDDTQDKNG